jgi:uncharacterized protein YjiS (DUF1127 family)
MSFYVAALLKHFPRFAVAPRLVLSRGLDRLQSLRRRREIICELSEYSPRELSELGIRLADIEVVAASGELR